jgi:hypothetical protein
VPIITQEDIRLELLRLTYVHGRTAAEAIERAKELETYLVRGPSQPVLGLPKKADKGATSG